jgi:23S rRNA pseudouridine2604 synthase
LRFVLTEGRNRQIRRMCELVDLAVTDLLRTRIGPLRLGDLPEGRWRVLTADERDALVKASVGEARPAERRGTLELPRPAGRGRPRP